MLSYKKPSLDKFLEPLAVIFKHANPNVLTLLGSIPSILFFVFITNKWYLLAFIAFLGTAFDMIDGLVARKYNKETKFGGFLDSTYDRMSDFLIITAFSFASIVRWEITAPLLFLSFLTSYIRSRGELANNTASFAIGLIERTERLIIIAIALVVYIFFPDVFLGTFSVTEVVFIILLVLSFYTVSQRIIFAYKKL